MKKKTIATLSVGAALGAGLGVLFAPKSGKETREDLKNKLDELRNKLKSIDKEDIKKYIEDKINSIEEELKELDKEKVIKIAKEKAKKIEKECKELSKYVKEKGEPVLVESVEAIRTKAIDITKKTIAKLEA